MNDVNSRLIALARESRGLSQSELAAAVSLSQANLSKIESGDVPLSPEHLTALSRVLDYPEGFFSLNDPVYGPASNCTFYRKRQSLPSKDLRQILAKGNILRFQISRLLREIEIESPNRFKRFDRPAISSPRFIARAVRKNWGLPDGPIPNLIGAIESAGGIVVYCPFGTDRLDAFSQWQPGMPPIFFVNSEISMDRCRFTLAHEIGHLVMHEMPSGDIEAEADEFAAEFLMPEKEIVHHYRALAIHNLPTMKEFWRVSMAAIIKRARDLNQISESKYRKLFSLLSRMGYRKSEPYPISREEPTVLDGVIDVHTRVHGYSIEQLANIACTTVHEFTWQFLPNTRKLRLISPVRSTP